MKQIIATASLLILIVNGSIAQQKADTKKATVKNEAKKEPCFVSEFDAAGKEIKVPCDTKSKTTVTNTRVNEVTVNSEIDAAQGLKKYYILEFNALGKEIKSYGTIIEEFDATGKSMLYFQYPQPSGVLAKVPAKLQ